MGNVDDVSYNNHIQSRESARAEKAKDKQLALTDDTIAVVTVDVQAVLLCPSLQASALYKTNLAVHNFTIYDLSSSDVTCYLWHEGEADLSANIFDRV